MSHAKDRSNKVESRYTKSGMNRENTKPRQHKPDTDAAQFKYTKLLDTRGSLVLAESDTGEAHSNRARDCVGIAGTKCTTSITDKKNKELDRAHPKGNTNMPRCADSFEDMNTLMVTISRVGIDGPDCDIPNREYAMPMHMKLCEDVGTPGFKRSRVDISEPSWAQL